MTTRYFGPCRAGLRPEFGWGTPCLNDATEYVEVHYQPAPDVAAAALMRLCDTHATLAEQLPGFHSRRALGEHAHTYAREASRG